MEVWETSRHCCDILKAESAIIDGNGNTWSVSYTFKICLVFNIVCGIVLNRNSDNHVSESSRLKLPISKKTSQFWEYYEYCEYFTILWTSYAYSTCSKSVYRTDLEDANIHKIAIVFYKSSFQ